MVRRDEPVVWPKVGETWKCKVRGKIVTVYRVDEYMIWAKYIDGGFEFGIGPRIWNDEFELAGY